MQSAKPGKRFESTENLQHVCIFFEVPSVVLTVQSCLNENIPPNVLLKYYYK